MRIGMVRLLARKRWLRVLLATAVLSAIALAAGYPDAAAACVITGIVIALCTAAGRGGQA